jgi:DNA-binding transcriptional regulator YdaS (Cro superfamily)
VQSNRLTGAITHGYGCAMTLSEYLATEGARNQAEIADAVNVSRVFISLVASGQRQPSLPVALKIEAATDGKVSVAELVKPSPPATELREAS